MSEYAFYDGTNPPERVPALPGAARDLVTGDWVMGLDQQRPGIKRARKRAGYYVVRNTQKPAVDKLKEKLVRKLEMLGEEPAFTYTVQQLTTDELLITLAENEITLGRAAVRRLRKFRLNQDPSLVEMRENMDVINRILIQLLLDKYGEV